MKTRVLIVVVTLIQIKAALLQEDGDGFDAILAKMNAITADNCKSKPLFELQLPASSIPSTVIQRSKLAASMSNLAYSKALLYSFQFQQLQTHETFAQQPGLLHYYLGAGADLSSSALNVTDAGILFGVNCSYPNYLQTVYFNTTLPLFGAHGVRAESSLLQISDPGVGDIDNYTVPDSFLPYARITTSGRNFWWPSERGKQFLYTVTVDNQTKTFYGPPSASDASATDFGPPPVIITSPYFDCGRTNRWKVTATSAVVDILARYTAYKYLQHPTYSAVTAIDADFMSFDINQCPQSAFLQDNVFAGTDKCRNTTVCAPISGFGFRRGGYQCSCKPGYQYPRGQKGPFQGVHIENEPEENREKFDCILIRGANLTVPTRTVRPDGGDDPVRHASILTKIAQVNQDNCQMKSENELKLTDDILFGIRDQFDVQASSAVRLAHFISSFLQNVRQARTFADDFIHGDLPLNKVQLYGEVLSIVMSDPIIMGAGIYFEPNVHKEVTANKRDWSTPTWIWNVTAVERFAPFASRTSPGTKESSVEKIDITDISKRADRTGGTYTERKWYQTLKQSWSSLADRLQTYRVNATARRLKKENVTVLLTDTPLTYQAALVEDGEWAAPEFKCHVIKEWVTTYSIPFFGMDESTQSPVFSGVVSVNLKFTNYDINQCPSTSGEPNAFNNTAKCHYSSQYCVPIKGQGLTLGSYKCECLPYHRPNDVTISWFSGSLMEDEYDKKMNGEANRYDELVCVEAEYPDDGGTSDVTTTGDNITSNAESVEYKLSTIALVAFVFIANINI